MNTDRFFQNLSAYLLNKDWGYPPFFTITTPFRQTSEDDNLLDKIKNSLNATSFTTNGWLQLQNQDTPLNVIVIFGKYLINGDTTEYGFIMLINSKLQIVKTYTEYANGTKLREIVSLNQNNNDYTFFGIEKRSNATGYRFVMFNNFALKTNSLDYTLTLRRSYNMPTPFDVDTTKLFNKVIKSEDTADYCYAAKSTTNEKLIYLGTLKVNVGSENEWNYYQNTNDYNYIRILDIIGVWTDDKLHAQILFYYGDSSRNALRLNFQTDTFDRTNWINCNAIVSSGVLTSFDEYWFSCNRLSNGNKTNTHLVYKQKSGRVASVEQEYNFTEKTIPQEIDNSYFQDNIFYELRYIPKEDGNYEESLGVTTIEFQTPSGYNAEMSSIAIDMDAQLPEYNGIVPFYAVHNYNLITFLASNSTNTYRVYSIYNINNYNGDSYLTQTGLVPNSSILYENYKDEYIPIFARNIYNKTINGNTTTSVVQVPNVLLNDESIDRQSLYSLSNNEINQSNSTLTKNIYETLNINFATTLLIEDRNVREVPIINQNASNVLNGYISSTDQSNYNNIYMPRVVVKYDDGTNLNVDLTDITQGTEVNQNHNENVRIANVKFAVSFYKKVNEIDFVSNDGNVVYAVIDTSNYEYGGDTVYEFNQKINFQKWEDLNEEV